MIGTVLKIGWLNLKRDRVAQALTFLLPILFFSIFSTVFSNQNNPTSRIRVAVVDEDRSDYSKKLIAALGAEGGLRVETSTSTDGNDVPLDRQTAESRVKRGDVPIAVVVPAGFGGAPQLWPGRGVERPKILIFADVSDPVAPQMVQGLLQKVAFTAAPESLAQQGVGLFEKYAGPLTPAQRESFDRFLSSRSMEGPTGSATGSQPAGAGVSIGLPTEVVNVMQAVKGTAINTISFYAAGTGVMFLLFSCAGAGGALLEEEESGTLGRLIGSRLGMRGVLLGKWMFLALVGTTQLTVMFTWGAIAFGLPLLSHLPGFVLMTLSTAAAGAAFGLVLATISRSRQQLQGYSTIIILAMSAIGGSMFPRFLMSETMQRLGLVTFNAWALDGYLKVFWRNAPLVELWPQLLVLSSLTIVFLLAARQFARRWEAA
jgi:ABC-2 type transport system permease protein